MGSPFADCGASNISLWFLHYMGVELTGRCIACGSRADLVEYEKVLQLFFVPVWRWPGKEPLMYCNNCNILFPPKFSPPPPPSADSPPPRQLPDSAFSDVLCCQFCSREVDPSFRFCPFCGSSL